ncbi:hypothetical protein Q7P37_010364 [Cladosporium fusiforme]
MTESEPTSNNARNSSDATSRNNRKTTTRRNRARSNVAPVVDEGPSPGSDRALSIVTTSSDEPLHIAQPHTSSTPIRKSLLSGEKSMHSLLAEPTTEKLLLHFNHVLCKHLAVAPQVQRNPFRLHVLPLAYEHPGVLLALMGFSMCHLSITDPENATANTTAALEYRIAAIQSLSELFLKFEVSGLSTEEREVSLAIVLLLILHDVCESGVSYNGTHLTGVSGLCEQFAALDYAVLSERQRFLLAMLSWLDFLRGMSGAEKLAFSDNLRSVVRDDVSNDFELTTGCPAEVFYQIGKALSCAKAHLANEVTEIELQLTLDTLADTISLLDLQSAIYPSQEPEWAYLAEAFRQVCLLRILRFPDAFKIPCEDPRVTYAVETILNSCARISRNSAFYKRLLFPLFIAGVETSVPYQQDYVSLCVRSIVETTGFQHASMHQILMQVHEERVQNSLAWGPNVPWMEFTCSAHLPRQHDYLFF